MSIRNEIESIETRLESQRGGAEEFIDDLPYEQFGLDRSEAIEEANRFMDQNPSYRNSAEAIIGYFTTEHGALSSPEIYNPDLI